MQHHIINLGCKVNRVESDQFERSFIAFGSEASELEDADVVIVNTCAVTGEAEKKTRKTVRRALSATNAKSILVTGCAAALSPGVYEEMDDRVRVVPKGDMSCAIEDLLASHSSLVRCDAAPELSSQRARMGLKIQDGCDNECTYCVVRIARGPSKNMPHDRIVRSCIDLVESGVREIVLTGINLGSFGRRTDGEDLPSLLSQLLRTTRDMVFDEGYACRFRLSSIEPMDIDEKLLELIAESDGRICAHLHMPIQSGSESVLSRMNRDYSPEGMVALSQIIYDHLPHVSLTTDIIAGFPGETDADFKQTKHIAIECGFSKLHVFPYSARDLTLAASMEDQVPPEVKIARARELRDLAKNLRAADFEQRRGTIEACVVEERGRGCTESYYEIVVDEGIPVGTLARVRLEELA